MPHLRNRHIETILLKRMKLWPVVGLLGPRQVGKSTLLRERIAPTTKGKYVTLDIPDVRRRAESSPMQFLDQSHPQPLIIDEVQKAPELFDSIKAHVDLARKPGRFLISGSTEFSRKTGVRESLTGRIGLLRLYPLTLAELHEQVPSKTWLEKRKPASSHFSLEDISRASTRGGMPGICFLREQNERVASFESWLETTCHRDLSSLQGSRLNGGLARDILGNLAKVKKATSSEIARSLREDTRRIAKHLEALEALFVLLRLPAHSSGVGKDEFYPFDAGLAHHIELPLEASWKILLMNEILAEYESVGKPRPKLSHYLSSRGSYADLVIETPSQKGVALFILDAERIDAYALRSPMAFLKRNPSFECRIIYTGNEFYEERPGIKIQPLTSCF